MSFCHVLLVFVPAVPRRVSSWHTFPVFVPIEAVLVSFWHVLLVFVPIEAVVALYCVVLPNNAARTAMSILSSLPIFLMSALYSHRSILAISSF